MVRNETTCVHCRETKYVFVYWLEKGLQKHNVHMTDIPPEIFKKIPLEFLLYCHCNPLVASQRKPSYIESEILHCQECDGLTWCFSKAAEEAGYRWKKVRDLPWPDLKTLPCEYFERCPCGEDDSAYKSPKRTESLRDILGLLKSSLPRLSLGSIFP